MVAGLRGGWGRPVLRAVCDHKPHRLRLFDADERELPIAFFQCRYCDEPMFLDADGRPTRPFNAVECGCIWPDPTCSYHSHPVHGVPPLDDPNGGRRGD